ncbi:MAG: hypothetical protein HY897_13860 [Deltaproteobacteria bacterium]|nr:hypothetical protein [Deltaproteobacteria bacterium]
MKRPVGAVVVGILVPASAFAMEASVTRPAEHEKTPVVGQGHKQACVFCHTPSETATAAAPDVSWTAPCALLKSYDTYQSAASKAKDRSDIGLTADRGAQMSMVCMNCHDGTLAGNSHWIQPGAGEDGKPVPVLDGTLRNDHPVNFTYDALLASADKTLAVPASRSEAAPGLPLYDGKMQCATCHNVHDNTHGSYLRVSNKGSALCLACHEK